MKKASRLFRRLNCAACCNNSFNRLALRISRGLCEANDALPSRKGCCEKDRCDRCDTHRRSQKHR